MKVFDLNGCEIRINDPLYFQALKAIVKVTDIKEPGVIDDKAPGYLAVELRIPFRPEKGEKDVRFGDFIATRDPIAEASVESQVNDILTRNAPKRPLQMGKAG